MAQSGRLEQVGSRPLLTLFKFAIGFVWFGAVLASVSETGDPIHGLVAGSITVLIYGLILIPVLWLVLLPAAVLTMVILQAPRSTRRRRFAVGAAAWVAWALIVGLASLAAPREDEVGFADLVGGLVAAGVMGAVFSMVAFARPWKRPGRVTIGLALVVVVFVVVGGFLTLHWRSLG
jgi:hypothetical protein